MKVKAGISEQFSGVTLHAPNDFAKRLRDNQTPTFDWTRFERDLLMKDKKQAPRVHDYKVTIKWDGGRLSEVFTSQKKADSFVCKLADRAWCNFISDGACDSFKDFETKIAKVQRFKETWELTSKQHSLLVQLCNSASGPTVRDNNGFVWRLVDKKKARGGLTAGQFGGGLSSLKRAGFYNKGWIRLG